MSSASPSRAVPQPVSLPACQPASECQGAARAGPLSRFVSDFAWPVSDRIVIIMWSNHLIHQLPWRVWAVHVSVDTRSRPKWRSPTWAWTSIDARVHYNPLALHLGLVVLTPKDDGEPPLDIPTVKVTRMLTPAWWGSRWGESWEQGCVEGGCGAVGGQGAVDEGVIGGEGGVDRGCDGGFERGRGGGGGNAVSGEFETGEVEIEVE